MRKVLGLLVLVVIFSVLVITNIVIYKNDFREIDNEFISLHQEVKVIKYWAAYHVSRKDLDAKIYKDMVSASVRIAGCGSGVFINDDVILTAAHVLENGGTFTIELCNGTILKSSNFYIDTKEDVGFLFVDANEIHIAKISSLPVCLGDTVFLVGRPHDNLFKFSLTKGIVSYLDRNLPSYDWADLLQTDAEGGRGSSGGPLYNSNGHLIGLYVGHIYDGGRGVSLCENVKSILEAYQRCKQLK